MLVALGATALMLGAAPASAATTYFGEDLHANDDTRATPTHASAAEASFLSALTADVGTEMFESFSTGDDTPLALVFPGAGSATLNGSGEIETVTDATGTDGNGRYPISGVNYWETGGGDFTIDFANPVAAFGFYGVDIGDFGSQLSVTLVEQGGVEASHEVAHTLGSDASTTGSIFFWGFVDANSPFTSARFEFEGGTESFAFDNMTIGSVAQVAPAVPEPSTYALMALGLAGIGVMVRRRKSKAA